MAITTHGWSSSFNSSKTLTFACSFPSIPVLIRHWGSLKIASFEWLGILVISAKNHLAFCWCIHGNYSSPKLEVIFARCVWDWRMGVHEQMYFIYRMFRMSKCVLIFWRSQDNLKDNSCFLCYLLFFASVPMFHQASLMACSSLSVCLYNDFQKPLTEFEGLVKLLYRLPQEALPVIWHQGKPLQTITFISGHSPYHTHHTIAGDMGCQV